jgi:hypothetical protein
MSTDPEPTMATIPKEGGESKEGAEGSGFEFFSTKRPKDAGAGLSSAFKSVLKGTLAGAVSLVASPIAGAQEEGTIGFFKGKLPISFYQQSTILRLTHLPHHLPTNHTQQVSAPASPQQ